MSKEKMSPDQLRFLDDLASLMLPWGMTTAVARLYGYLLLQDKPASLDQICDQLEVSKSTASVAARQLEKSKLVRRHSERGSKRVYFRISEEGASTMNEQATMLGDLGALMQKNVSSATGKTAGQRLDKVAQFCFSMQAVIKKAISDLSTDWH